MNRFYESYLEDFVKEVKEEGRPLPLYPTLRKIIGEGYDIKKFHTGTLLLTITQKYPYLYEFREGGIIYMGINEEIYEFSTGEKLPRKPRPLEAVTERHVIHTGARGRPKIIEPDEEKLRRKRECARMYQRRCRERKKAMMLKACGLLKEEDP